MNEDREKKDYITTYSKRHVTPLDPDSEDISVRDIAHALSLMVRANGHFPEFYSVGQHCIHCALEAQAEGMPDRLVLACLLHDAGEAYLADITRPVKQHLPKYRETEQKLLDAVYRRFLGSALTAEEEKEVKRVDDTLLYYEFLYYMGEALQKEPPKLWSRPVFETRPFADVEREYLRLFKLLTGKKI